MAMAFFLQKVAIAALNRRMKLTHDMVCTYRY